MFLTKLIDHLLQLVHHFDLWRNVVPHVEQYAFRQKQDVLDVRVHTAVTG